MLPNRDTWTAVGGRHDLLARLRTDTRAAHDSIEATLGLLDPAVSTTRYRFILEQFRGLYAPLEAQLAAIDDWEAYVLDVPIRRKQPLIDADLRALGLAEPERLPAAAFLPALHQDRAAAFGCLYVLEGATLGGQVISRHLRSTLGITPSTGGAFFHGYGERTGTLWASFREALLNFEARGGDADVAVETASQTFRAFQMAMGGSAT
jgi:heme oxygenase (biliverdin-IX-beta and delta-forming)